MPIFPITKNQLHNSFFIKKNISDNEKTKILNDYINDKVDLISYKIIGSTIDEKTHAKLNNNHVIKYIPKINTEKKCVETIKIISDRSEEETNILKAKIRKEQILTYIFDSSCNELNKKLNDNIKHINYTSNSINETDLNNAKIKILEELRVRFPDSIITIDDKHTHIIIDWN